MKIYLPLLIFLSLSACINGEEPSTLYKPVLIERTDLEKSIQLLEARELTNPGKIYTYGDYIFVNELYSGIHIIENSNPNNPNNMAFISIPGNVDIAVKDGIIYADNSVDLVSLRINNMETLEILTRNRDVFDEPTPPDLNVIPSSYQAENRPVNTFIIKWVLK